ncbi:MAG: hypothetical protein IBX57_00115 [Gammaproteobacteria bacterium]|nr:hypothetical protein [Gammaproteobacteria bacterium]
MRDQSNHYIIVPIDSVYNPHTEDGCILDSLGIDVDYLIELAIVAFNSTENNRAIALGFETDPWSTIMDDLIGAEITDLLFHLTPMEQENALVKIANLACNLRWLFLSVIDKVNPSLRRMDTNVRLSLVKLIGTTPVIGITRGW